MVKPRETATQKDARNFLKVLKFELEYLEKRGSGHSPRPPRRLQFIFDGFPM